MSKYLRVDTPASDQASELKSEYDLANLGLEHLDRVFWNLRAPALYEESAFRREGCIADNGPLVIKTGKWTARAAQDKYVVKEPTSEDNIWWGEYNRPMAPEKFDALFARVQAYLQGHELFVQDCYVGADSEYRMPVRVVTEHAWQSLFARNVLIPIHDKDKLKHHVPEFTVVAVPNFHADPRADGTRTDTIIVINFARRIALICNSQYGGEIKKSVFTVMNYLLPLRGVLTMHCSANVGDDGDVALFFGLSGTGKTTLSADPLRKLIGDDEHGWSDNGVFNFEGGCYAKVIRLSEEHEPQIYDCTRRFGTILENVVLDPTTRHIDLDDATLTENTRAAYPIDFIPNVVKSGMAHSHPKNVVLLTCDAQGVLPPIARLSPDQAVFHFISGYTSKIAGTEIGLGIEPQITFSTCFGAPFMVHHPFMYARMLRQRMIGYGAQCWLVNTGWVGGNFWTGKRISIHHTRHLLNAALQGKLNDVPFRKDKLFGFDIPTVCPNVPDSVLDPSSAWNDQDDYWRKYDALVARYLENFKQFAEGCPPEVASAGPKRLSEV